MTTRFFRMAKPSLRAGAMIVVSLVWFGGPVEAAPKPEARLAWSTYLRSGPGATYRVMDELEHDTAVVVVGCSARWCRVSADGLEGFVDQDALELPRTPAPRPQAGAACVVVGQADARAPRPTRFCSPGAPEPKPAPGA